MTQIERAFHEKWIKGVTLKLIVTVMISTITIIGTGVWAVAIAYTDLKQSFKDEKVASMQFTKDQISALRNEMNARFDTIKINQILFNYNTKLEIQKTRSQKQHTQFVTETRDRNGHIIQHPYQNN